MRPNYLSSQRKTAKPKAAKKKPTTKRKTTVPINKKVR